MESLTDIQSHHFKLSIWKKMRKKNIYIHIWERISIIHSVSNRHRLDGSIAMFGFGASVGSASSPGNRMCQFVCILKWHGFDLLLSLTALTYSEHLEDKKYSVIPRNSRPNDSHKAINGKCSTKFWSAQLSQWGFCCPNANFLKKLFTPTNVCDFLVLLQSKPNGCIKQFC